MVECFNFLGLILVELPTSYKKITKIVWRKIVIISTSSKFIFYRLIKNVCGIIYLFKVTDPIYKN